MQLVLNVVLGLLLFLIPTVSIYFTVKATRRAEKAEDRTRELLFKGLLDETKKEIDSASPDDLVAMANAMYPKGDRKP